MLELRGKVAVVTGAAGGIGSAVASALSREGCRVIAVDLDAARLEALDAELGATAMYAMDVSDAAGWDELAARVASEHGGASVLVNNAGVTVLGAFADQSREDIDRILAVNVGSVLHGSRAFLPQLREGDAGHIVNVSSLAGRVAFPYQTTYSATKFAVRGFSAALRMELRSHGVGVTAVLPGAVATKLLETARSYDHRASGKLAALMLTHGLRPEKLAARILKAVRADEAEVLAGWDAHVTTTAQAIAPSLVSAALALAFRLRHDRP